MSAEEDRKTLHDWYHNEMWYRHVDNMPEEKVPIVLKRVQFVRYGYSEENNHGKA